MTTDSPAVRAARRALSSAIIATGNAEAEMFRARRREHEAEETLSRALRAQREADNNKERQDHVG